MGDSLNPFCPLPTIETARLRLRPVRRADAADMFRDASDPRMSEYTTWSPHRSIDDSYGFIERVLDRYGRGEVAPWAIEHLVDRRYIGTIGYMSWWRHHRRADIGYALGPPYWGQGLMTEAAGAVIDFGFEVLDLHRIQAEAEPANTGSTRVMEKCGMRYEGTQREGQWVKGRFVDLKVYAILRSEWEAQRSVASLPD